VKLQQLFFMYDFKVDDLGTSVGNDASIAEAEISLICFDARLAIKNSIFVAISGSKFDGHQFIQQAIDNGAIALVVENTNSVPADFNGFVLPTLNSRKMLDILSAKFYNFPSEKLFCIGVTGTNGKTSITYLLEHILNSQKKMTGIMGTVNHRVGDKIWDSDMTTPDPVTLQKRLREFIDHGAAFCALEVSSHALDQKRADSVHFNTVVFTNLTLDHLDYHKNMKNYFSAKQRLFSELLWVSTKKPIFAVVNIDDSYGRRIQLPEHVVGWTYGQKDSDFQFKIITVGFDGTEFELRTPLETVKVQIPLTGLHNVYNAVAAMATALTAGISILNSIKSLQSFSGIPGRLQKVQSRSDKKVFVDYAHTPDALKNSLMTLKKIKQAMTSEPKIITVFGCGGDRDKSKRPLMAEIAAEYSDFVFITSDNPRTENPDQIITEIQVGLPSAYENFEIDSDRARAIQKAINMAEAGDVVLIAGKGHEDYQIIGDIKHHFSDVEVAERYL
jgi:UDP-N-acetylmuramoyl-L-alanyl-D-glutamate--2,6-diaminopimelate ligase